MRQLIHIENRTDSFAMNTQQSGSSTFHKQVQMNGIYLTLLKPIEQIYLGVQHMNKTHILYKTCFSEKAYVLSKPCFKFLLFQTKY